MLPFIFLHKFLRVTRVPPFLRLGLTTVITIIESIDIGYWTPFQIQNQIIQHI